MAEADRGFISTPADTGFNLSDTSDVAVDDYGGYDYSGGGGGGGGGGSYADYKREQEEKQQRQNQAQLKNTAGNYQKRKEDLDKMAEDQFGSLQKQREANDQLYAQQKRQIGTNVQWQPNQQKQQSSLMALRNRAGNSLYGSALQDLNEGMGRVDDMNDVELINTYKQNMDNAANNWYQADTSLVADYNDQVVSTQDEYSKLRSQYWSTMSNVAPELLSKENLEKSFNGEEVTEGEDTDEYTLPAIDLSPSEAVKKLMVIQDTKRPTSQGYVRPAGSADVRLGGSKGNYTVNPLRKQYAENLAAFRRV